MSAYIDFHKVATDALAAHPSTNLYFLLDHAGMPGLSRQLGKGVSWKSLFESTKEENALAASPILILVGTKENLHLSRSFFRWIGKNGTYSSTVVMLLSPLSTDSMRMRLTERLEVRLPDEMEAMLRFFDPRVLEGLIKVLAGKQASDFFSLAEKWCYVNRSGCLVEFKTRFDCTDPFHAPMSLDRRLEDALLAESEIDQVMSLIRENLPELLKNIPLAQQSISVNRAINSAKFHDLESTVQLALYTAVILSNGESVTNAPFWQDFVAGLKNDDLRSVDLLPNTEFVEMQRIL